MTIARLSYQNILEEKRRLLSGTDCLSVLRTECLDFPVPTETLIDPGVCVRQIVDFRPVGSGVFITTLRLRSTVKG